MRHLKTLAAVLCIAVTLTLAGASVITPTLKGGAAHARRDAAVSPRARGAQEGDGLGRVSGLPPLALALGHDIDHER